MTVTCAHCGKDVAESEADEHLAEHENDPQEVLMANNETEQKLVPDGEPMDWGVSTSQVHTVTIGDTVYEVAAERRTEFITALRNIIVALERQGSEGR